MNYELNNITDPASMERCCGGREISEHCRWWVTFEGHTESEQYLDCCRSTIEVVNTSAEGSTPWIWLLWKLEIVALFSAYAFHQMYT